MTVLRALTPLRLLQLLLVWNYVRHRLGLSTICSEGRELVPAWAFDMGWSAFNRWFIPHWLNGYRKETL